MAVRTYLAGTELQGAAHFGALAEQVEKSHQAPTPQARFTQHRVYVIGAVMLAVGSLEGTINELLGDAAEHPGGRAAQLPDGVRERLSCASTLDSVDRAAVLDKYQVALLVAGKSGFDPGQQPYQDAALLVRLRNALVHYRPEWTVTIGWEKEVEKLEKQLRGKFQVNPLTGAGNPFFPDRCLGSGCAKWSATTAATYLNHFHERIGLPSPHSPIEGWLAGTPEP